MIIHICVCVSVCINEEKGMWQIQQPLMIQTLRKKGIQEHHLTLTKSTYKKTTSWWKNEYFSTRLGMRQDVLEVLASGMRRKEEDSDWKKNNCLYWQIPKSAKQLLELITGDFSPWFQWLRIQPTMQGTRVWYLVRAKIPHDMKQPAQMLQLLSPHVLPTRVCAPLRKIPSATAKTTQPNK